MSWQNIATASQRLRGRLVVGASVGDGSVKVQIRRIARDTKVNYIGHFDADRAAAVKTVALDFDIFQSYGNIQFPRLLVHRVTDSVFTLHVVAAPIHLDHRATAMIARTPATI